MTAPAAAPGLTLEAMLAELREVWQVVIEGEAGELWVLTLWGGRPNYEQRQYRGTDLGRVVRAAWASERPGRVS